MYGIFFSFVTDHSVAKIGSREGVKSEGGKESSSKESTILSKKIHLVERTLTLLNQMLSKYEGDAKQQSNLLLSRRVREYFLELKEQLQKRENIPLPKWYHPLGINGSSESKKIASLRTVLLEGRITQQRGTNSTIAVRVSPNFIEADSFVTLGFDSEIFTKRSVSTATNEDDHDLLTGSRVSSLWVDLQTDILINSKTIAFLSCANHDIALVERIVNESGLKLRVMDKAVAELAHLTLNQVRTKFSSDV